MTRYEPRILTFSPTRKGEIEDMEAVLFTWTIEGWEIISVTHMQGIQPVYTVFLQREVSEQVYEQVMEKRA